MYYYTLAQVCTLSHTSHRTGFTSVVTFSFAHREAKQHSPVGIGCVSRSCVCRSGTPSFDARGENHTLGIVVAAPHMHHDHHLCRASLPVACAPSVCAAQPSRHSTCCASTANCNITQVTFPASNHIEPASDHSFKSVHSLSFAHAHAQQAYILTHRAYSGLLASYHPHRFSSRTCPFFRGASARPHCSSRVRTVNSFPNRSSGSVFGQRHQNVWCVFRAVSPRNVYLYSWHGIYVPALYSTHQHTSASLSIIII